MNIKYTFENIGPITKTEMELGDLTIIAGKNNTGKTYLAYGLYGFLKFLSKQKQHLPIYASTPLGARIKFDRNNMVKKKDGSCEILISLESIEQCIEKRMSEFTTMFSPKEIHRIFSTPQFNEAKIGCELGGEIKMMKESEPRNLGISVEIPSDKKNWYRIKLNKFLLDSWNQIQLKIDGIDDNEIDGVDDIVTNFFLHHYISPSIPSAFVLTSERFGISLFYKELDFAKNRLVEELQNISDRRAKIRYNEDFLVLERSSARYAKPIKDNIDFTRYLEHIQKRRSRLTDYKLLEDIENIMGGYYRYANNEIQFISKQGSKNKFNIPLHTASSSARGLSDVYFYLKHVAQKGDLLIIDEPESHLDTKNQILMARLLARCVNAGIKVLITTHSDYIIKEFNNLIMLSQKFDYKDKFYERYKEYTKNDYLKPESVKGYICEKGGLTECEIIKNGMDMPVFDDTIRHINDISNILNLALDE